jgi:hypothetical protein
MDYEMTCDASKMMSLDTAVPQIYSLDADDTPYAINERPMDNGTLRLGIIIKDAGEYTISAIRNDLGRILLIDHETGITTDLQQGGYVFSAESGTYQSRFSLSFGDNSITGIKVATRPTADSREVYTLDGRKVSNSTDQLKQGVYVVREGQKTQKVIIK